MGAINWKNTDATKVEFTAEPDETPFAISRTKYSGHPVAFGVCAVTENGPRTGRLYGKPSAPMVVIGTKGSHGVWYERVVITKEAWRALVEAEYKKMHPEGLDNAA